MTEPKGMAKQALDDLTALTSFTVLKAQLVETMLAITARFSGDNHVARNMCWAEHATEQLDEALSNCTPDDWMLVEGALRVPGDCGRFVDMIEYMVILCIVSEAEKYAPLSIEFESDGGLSINLWPDELVRLRKLQHEEDNVEMDMRHAEAARDGR